MKLEIHDDTKDDPQGTLMGCAHNIDFMYQAEEWIQQTLTEKRVARWVLFNDEQTPIHEWHLINGEIVYMPVTPGTVADPRTFRPRKQREQTG